MRRHLHHSRHIDAGVKAVWAVITDTAGFGRWNPVVTDARGEWVTATPLAFTVKLPGGRPRSLLARVLRVVDERELGCVVRTGAAGLLDIHYEVRLEPDENSGVELLQSVTISGLMMPFFWLRRRRALSRALEEMAQSLAARAT